MKAALKSNKIANIYVEKLIREASDNFSYNRNYDLALEQVNQILGVDPNNVKALILKGDILFCMDEDTKALEYFERAIQADPFCPEAYGSKAGVLDVLGEYKESLANCDKAFKLVSPKDKFLLPSLYDQKLTLLIRLRRFEEAQRIVIKAINTLPEDDANYIRGCYKSMIDCSYRLKKRKLAQVEKLSLKVI